MAFSFTTYTAASGATTAFSGQTIASATWDAIFTDMQTSFTQVASGAIGNRVAITCSVANTDFAIPITMPTGFSRFRVTGIWISGASQTLTTTTVALFSAPAAGGTQVITSTALTINTSVENTNNNYQLIGAPNPNTQCYNFATLYFRVMNPQGAAASANVLLQVLPLS